MVRRFIDKADTRTRNEIEKLISGEEIVKEIRQELTYSELDSSIENLWSVLFTTGYLTQRGQVGTDTFKLAIPNLEIRRLFIKQIREWFRETSQSDGETLNEFVMLFQGKILRRLKNCLVIISGIRSVSEIQLPQKKRIFIMEFFWGFLVISLIG